MNKWYIIAHLVLDIAFIALAAILSIFRQDYAPLWFVLIPIADFIGFCIDPPSAKERTSVIPVSTREVPTEDPFENFTVKYCTSEELVKSLQIVAHSTTAQLILYWHARQVAAILPGTPEGTYKIDEAPIGFLLYNDNISICADSFMLVKGDENDSERCSNN